MKAPDDSSASIGGSGASPFPPARKLFTLAAGSHRIALGGRTLVQAILNCTPDSFFDGGRHPAGDALVRRMEEIEAEGADWIDIGGESTRPGAGPVDAEEEWRRIAPALDLARRRIRLPVSVDTTKPEVARRAMEAGAVILNDVSGLQYAPELADLAARHGAALILMHMKGLPRTMQVAPHYDDLSGEIGGFLRDAAAAAESRGVGRDRIILDPGIGFGKTVEHNCELIRRIPDIADLGYPVLIGASRKGFIGKILGTDAEDRLEGSLAAHCAAVLAGAHVVRAHDVRATVRAIRIIDALRITP